VARDGTERPIADSGAPVRTGSGELAGVVLVFRDQSAERASELALRRSEERFRLLFAHMQEGLALHEIVCDDAGTPVDYRFLEVNPAFERLTGLSAPHIVGKTVLEVLPHTEPHWIEAYGRVALTGEPAHFEEYSRELDRYYQVTAYCPKRGQFAVVFEEVTERRRAEVEREITVDLLRLLNASNDLPRLAQDVTRLLQEWSGCEAVGIRLRRGADYPYFETRGFSSAGPAAEGGACAEAAPGGGPQLECLCRQVLEGRTDPARPYFTAEGTFWTNSRSDLRSAAREQGLPEGAPSRCDGEGYESVALVPLRFAGETFGLLQLNDRRRGRFSPERVALFERLAASLAVGLSQRRAAAELAVREAQARSILRAAPVGIGVAAQRVLREVNDAMTAITGYSREELLGQPARVLYPSEADFEAVGRAYVQFQAGGRAAAETRWRRKDGRVIEVALHASVIDPSDPSQGITFAAQDITNFRRGERLAQARLALSSFAEDHGLEELLQKTVDEAEGLTESQIGFFHFVESDQATLSLQAWSTRTLAAPCTAGGKGRHYGVGDAGVWADCIRERRAVVHNDYAALPNRRGLPPGHAVLVREAVVPVFRENRIVAVLGVGNKEADYGEEDVRDLSVLGSMAWDLVSRKRAEEEREALQAKFLQAQKMEAVGRLAGGVAHDFNNMLQVILGYTDLALAGTPAQSPLAENLRHVQEAAEHSAALTRQLLAFARRQTIVPRVLDLNEAVAGLLKMLGRLIGESIELVWRPSGRPAVVRMDPSQLGQVLANLVVNSRDALEGAGSITLETGHAELDAAYCAAHPGARVGPHVLLAVTDSGGGMDEQTRAHLFEPFFTTKPAGVGTGLGLATVYGIVKQNEGFVSVYSELGQGTSVKIYLPRYDAEPEASGRGAAPRELPRGSETVLLVEDEHSLLDLERRILEELGYTVLACSTPLEALEAADSACRIDLLLTDVVLPGMNGRELRDRLTAKRPDLKCLFMSGYTANAIAHRGVLGDGVHFLQKPFSTADLAAKVREVLER
jgi:PAS domain S-box-containing protein